MTPLWIELDGIRSFTTTRRISFADLGLFAILGDTGAGKSSILEAMVYALFNATTWDGVNVKELMSTSAARMRVQFSFILKERIYTVSRGTPREGAASHLLQCEGDSSERRDGATAVDRRIEELLGVDRETFIKTVILPQGQFAALLTLRPAERTKLLTDILGLNVIDDMLRALARPRERATALAARLRGERSRLPADPAAAIASAQAGSERAIEARASLETAVTETRDHESRIAAIAAEVQARARHKASLETAEPEYAKLSSLSQLDEHLRFEAKVAEEARTGAAEKLEAATRQLTGLVNEGRDVETLGRTSESLGRLVVEHLERAREETELEKRRANLQTAMVNLTDAAEHFGSAESARKIAREAYRLAQLRTRSETAALTTAERAFSELATARAEAFKAGQLARDAAAAELKAAGAATLAQDDFNRLRGVLQSAKDALERAQREDAAAHAAQGLSPGDACPVCQRPLPKGFHAPSAPDLTQCLSAERAASESARSAQEKLTRAQTIHEQRVFASANAAEQRDRCVQVQERRVNAAKDAGLDTQPGEAEASLSSIRNRAADIEKQALQADEAMRAAETAFALCLATHKGAEAAREQARGEVSACELSLAKRDGRIDAIRKAIPKDYRPKKESNGAAIADLSARLSKEIKAAKALDSLRIQAALEQNTASETLRRIEAKRETEVSAPRRDACTRLASVVTTLSSLGNQLTVSRIESSSAPLESAIAWAQEVVRAAESMRQKLDRDDARDLEQSTQHQKAVAKLLGREGAASSADLAKRHLAAVSSAAVAAAALASARRDAQDAAALDDRLTAIEPLERALNALQAALGDAKFKHFVAARKENNLLGVATTILGRMTDERYGFGQSFRIVDCTASQERSAQTLSGGEKFLASLALALALVEIAARGGGRFGALFLDEGFGTLDEHALDAALSELDTQASSGRLIGVITHVREVTEYIDAILKVTKTAGGSEVIRLDRSELDLPLEMRALASASTSPA